MKKSAVVMLAAMVLFSGLFFGKVKFAGESKVLNSLRTPVLQKLDPEVVQAARENGAKIEAENFKQITGKAYLKPEKDLGRLAYSDKRGRANGIAILVDFPETEPGASEVPGVKYQRVPVNYFNDLLNGTTYNPYELPLFANLASYKGTPAPIDRTMRNYYTEVSYGQFSIDVDVVDWVTLPHTYDYYLGQNKGFYNENGDAFIGELVSDAISAADINVDFSKYAVDATSNDLFTYEDGTFIPDENGNPVTKIVPNIFIIHRGTGAEYNLDPNVIWSHKWDMISAKYFGYYDQTGTYMDEKELKYMTVDGVAVNTYDICPEVGRDITGYLKYVYPQNYPPTYTGVAPSPAYPGVYAHEFGHMLGLPDQYDYGYESEGTGMFTLMASGSYGRNIPSSYYSGNTPVHIDAWSKYYLGFAEPKVIDPVNGKRQTITLSPVENYPDIYKINAPGSNGREYFLLENRQQMGYDVGLSYTLDKSVPHGLAVYQIVEDILVRNFHRPNEAQNWDTNHTGNSFKDKATGEHHYAISLIQADGNYSMEKGLNDGDAGDLFPGRNNVTSISYKSNQPINTTSVYKWDTTGAGTETGIVIENIIENTDGTITCDVIFTK